MKWTILAIAMLLASSAHAEQQCALHEMASFDLKKQEGGVLTIPVTINGKPETMSVDPSDPDSFLVKDYGDAEKFELSRASFRRRGVLTYPRDPLYTIPDFAIGGIHGKNLRMMRFDRPKSFDRGIVGGVSADILSRFDVEVDLQNSKLILFSQDHCPGKVVYWTKAAYAAIPFQMDAGSHSTFQMTLDGKPVSVSFTLWTGSARMGMKAAKRIFDIEENSWGMTRSVDASTGSPLYSFPFKTLSLNGIVISNPKIELSPEIVECRPPHCLGGSDVYLGTNELKKLHLYFAFKEQMLYVTPADAH